MRKEILLTLVLIMPVRAFAQVTAPNETGIAIGHVHLMSRDPDALKTIWIDAFGAQATKTGTLELLRLPGVFIIINKSDAPAGSVGSTADHLGFSVKSLSEMKTKLAGMNVQSDGEFVTLPDGLRIELIEDKSQTLPVVMHHIHLTTTNPETLRRWYVKTFGAENGTRRSLPTATFNGNEIDFVASSGNAPAATRGRVIDHIGFEVRDLEAFAKNLQAEGIKFEAPYRDMPNLNLKVAFIGDPVGTRIELTEGLRGK
jgi:catechol-2,3-dioxygenase